MPHLKLHRIIPAVLLLAGCTDVVQPEDETAVLFDRPLSELVLGGRLGDGGFESSSQDQGVPTGWFEFSGWGGTELGPGFDETGFLTNPEQCIVATGGYCTGGRFVYSAYAGDGGSDPGHGGAVNVATSLGGLPGSGNYGVAFTEDFLWFNPAFPGMPTTPTEILAKIVKAGSHTKEATAFQPFTGTWEFSFAFGMMTSAEDQGSYGTIEFTESSAQHTILQVSRNTAAPLGIDVSGFTTPLVEPFPAAPTCAPVAPYTYCSGWHIATVDVTALAGTSHGIRIRVHEGPHTSDAPVAFAFDDLSFIATLAASGQEGGPPIPLVAPHTSYMIDDPLTQAITHSWSLDAGATGCTLSDPSSATPSITGCADNGAVTLDLTKSFSKDAAGGGAPEPASETYTGTLTLTNVAPTVGPITDAPTDPVPLNAPLALSATYTDPGSLDTHTAQLQWGTAAATSCNAADGLVSGCTAPHAPGVYTVTVEVTDDDGGTGVSAPHSYIVVFDATEGHVTGGGWIHSPAGAYAADPGVAGRATMGFVSRYKENFSVPTGNVQFEVKDAGLRFKSTSHSWLVVTGERAQLEGVGTINGEGDYVFQLTAIDGALTGGSDLFRMQIRDPDTGAVIYDTQPGDGADAAPVTELGGGNLVVHK